MTNQNVTQKEIIEHGLQALIPEYSVHKNEGVCISKKMMKKLFYTACQAEQITCDEYRQLCNEWELLNLKPGPSELFLIDYVVEDLINKNIR
jgi:hypothetical protein